MGIEDLIKNANAGELVLHMDDEAFQKLIVACDAYIDGLEDLRTQAMGLANHPLGFSEDHLSSGAQLARTFQMKASGADNSAATTFKSHIDAAEKFKTLFLAARGAYRSAEEQNSQRFTQFDGQ